MFLLGKGGLFAVQYPFLLAVFVSYRVVHPYIPEVQGILQNLIGVDIICSVGVPCSNIIRIDFALARDIPGSGVGSILYMNVPLEV